jgi:hypothetical protein
VNSPSILARAVVAAFAEDCIVRGRAGVFRGLYTRTAAPSAHGPANQFGKVIRLQQLGVRGLCRTRDQR